MPENSLRELIDAARTRLRAELDEQLHALQERHEQQTAQARQQTRVDADLLPAFRDIDSGRSVSDTLSAIARSAARSARAVLFVVDGSELRPWDAAGAAVGTDVTGRSDLRELAGEAHSSGLVVRRTGGAMAAPLRLDGVVVAVLVGTKPENGAAGDGDLPWAGTVESIAQYGAARLGYLTALRTAQARQLIRRGDAAAATTGHGGASEERTAGGLSAGDGVEQDAQAARRYARLLVSEIKLYNEAAVRDGRTHRDLLRRLGTEVDRARRLYEERVATTVPDRARHFHFELVQTLAGGDPSLLG